MSSLHIDQNIEKIKSRRNEKPKPKEKLKKGKVPLFSYPTETIIYGKLDNTKLNLNIVATNPDEAQNFIDDDLRKRGYYDFYTSVVDRGGRIINGITEPAGENICDSFTPIVKRKRKAAERQNKLDLAAASRAAKIDRGREGLDNEQINKKLQRAHNRAGYKV